MHIDRDSLPAWCTHVVIPWGAPFGTIAPCSSVEKVVECLVKYRLTFRCEVVRVDGDVSIWPIHSKGGIA